MSSRLTATGAALGYVCANDSPYGAVGDCLIFTANGTGTGGSITTGTTALTVAGASFVSTDVGKAIVVDGAAANGSVLETTIASVTSGTAVTLSVAASATAANRTVYYGTNNAAAFGAALDAAVTAGKTLLVRDGGDYLVGAIAKNYPNQHVALAFAEGVDIRWIPSHPSWFSLDLSGQYGGVSHLGSGPWTGVTTTAITTDVGAGINTATGAGYPLITAASGISALGVAPGDLLLVGSNHPTWSPDSMFKLDGALIEVLTVDSDHQVTPKEFFYPDVYGSTTAFTVANGATLIKITPMTGVHLNNLTFFNPIIQTNPATVGPTNGFVRLSCARNVRVDNFRGRGAAGANIVTRFCHTMTAEGVSEAAEYSLYSGLVVGGTSYQRFAYGVIVGAGCAHAKVSWQDTRSGSAVDTSGEDTVGASNLYGYCYDVNFLNVVSDSSPTNGFAAHPGARGVRFKNCTVTNSRGTSAQIRCADWEMDGCYLEASAGSHLALFNRVENGVMRGCTLRKSGNSTNTGTTQLAAGSSASYLLGHGIAISTDSAAVIAAASISSMTAVGTLVTVTLTGTVASVAPWLSSGYTIDVAGATPATYNVTNAAVSAVSGSTFQYTAGSAPGGNATVLPTITQDFGSGLVPACNNIQFIDNTIDDCTHNAIRVGSTTNDLIISGGSLRNYGKNGAAAENYGVAFKGGVSTRARLKGLVFDDSQATVTSDRPYALNGGTAVDSSVDHCVSRNVLRAPSGSTALRDVTNAWGQGSSARVLLTDGVKYAANATGAVALDAAWGRTLALTLTGNVTLGVPVNPQMADGAPLRLVLIQDATGARTVTWNAIFKFAGGTAPVQTATAGKRDIYTLEYSIADSLWYCTAVVQNL